MAGNPDFKAVEREDGLRTSQVGLRRDGTLGPLRGAMPRRAEGWNMNGHMGRDPLEKGDPFLRKRYLGWAGGFSWGGVLEMGDMDFGGDPLRRTVCIGDPGTHALRGGSGAGGATAPLFLQ